MSDMSSLHNVHLFIAPPGSPSGRICCMEMETSNLERLGSELPTTMTPTIKPEVTSTWPVKHVEHAGLLLKQDEPLGMHVSFCAWSVAPF